MGECTCIVKVGTEAYKRGGVYFYARTIRVMKRLTSYDILSDEVDAVGTLEGLEGIINLQSAEDGLYVISVCNLSYDWESGLTDGYDLKLVPYTEENKREQ